MYGSAKNQTAFEVFKVACKYFKAKFFFQLCTDVTLTAVPIVLCSRIEME